MEETVGRGKKCAPFARRLPATADTEKASGPQEEEAESVEDYTFIDSVKYKCNADGLFELRVSEKNKISGRALQLSDFTGIR